MARQQEIRIMCFDDHQMILDGYPSVLQSQKGLNDLILKTKGVLVGPCADMNSLAAQVRPFNPHVILMDYSFGARNSFNGFDFSRNLKKVEGPNCPILCATDYNSLQGEREIRNEKIVDGVFKKTDEQLGLEIRAVLHRPLVVGNIGRRGELGYRMTQELFKSPSVERVISYGSIPPKKMYTLFETNRRGKLSCVESLRALNKVDLIINCSSTLRGREVIPVIQHETKQAGKFFADRRVLLPYERRHLEEQEIEIAKDIPASDLTNPPPFLQWLRYSMGHRPEFLYAAFEPDVSRVNTNLQNMPQRIPHEDAERLLGYLSGVHGEPIAILPERDSNFSDAVAEALKQSVKMAYDSQGAAIELGVSFFQPQVTNMVLIEDLAHLRTPRVNIAGYLRFNYKGKMHEGFAAYRPKVNWRDLSISPDMDWISANIGEGRFYSVMAPYLDEQKRVFEEMMKGECKVWKSAA